MNHWIVLNFEDGVTRFIHAVSSKAVADAAYRRGINIPLDCRDDACGTCRCLAEAGHYALGQDYIGDVLSAEEAARGYTLACQMRAGSDCVLHVPASPTLCRAGQTRYGARISEVRQLSPSTTGLLLCGETLASLAFLPGQYINPQVPGSEQCRAYSLSSLTKDGEVSFLIHSVPNGLMSGFLSGTTRASDSLAMNGPLGSLYLREIHRPLLMLAGDIGLTPFTAMLERIAGQGSAYPLHLIYGVTHDVDLVGFKHLETFTGRIPGFTWNACVASADSDYPCEGYVTEHIAAQHLHEGDVDIYLCGSPPMVEAVECCLRERGVRPANFYYEKFAASAA